MDRGRNLISGTKEELKNMITTTEKIIVGFSFIESETVEKMSPNSITALPAM